MSEYCSESSETAREPFDTNTAEVLPSTDPMPIVTMDVKLGQQYSFIDFNYEQFNQEADRLGLSDEAKDKLSIGIKPRLPGGGNGGVYQPYAKSLYVRASNGVNKSLVHEMKHYADDEEGLIRLSPRHVMGKLGLLALLSTGSISIVTDAVQMAQGNFNYFLGTHPLDAIAIGTGFGWLWATTSIPMNAGLVNQLKRAMPRS
jgi:hypothetical protein